MKNSPFYKQAELMLRCLASLKEQKEFALKGGTALNFFIFDLPRLSVDIDLVFLPDHPRDKSLQAISDGLSKLGNRIEKTIPGSKVQKTNSMGSTLTSKINVLYQDLSVTIEPNLVIRTTLKPPKTQSIVKRAQDLFETEQEVLVLDRNEILAGKICAALDRQHPRDFFDIHHMFKNKIHSDEVRSLFLVYLCGGSRPLHEVLVPTLLNIKGAYESQFKEMSDSELTLDDLYSARNQLINWIHGSLTNDEREFLISFIELRSDYSKINISGAENFPSVLWKKKNLEILRDKNPKKFKLQSTELKDRFDTIWAKRQPRE